MGEKQHDLNDGSFGNTGSMGASQEERQARRRHSSASRPRPAQAPEEGMPSMPLPDPLSTAPYSRDRYSSRNRKSDFTSKVASAMPSAPDIADKVASVIPAVPASAANAVNSLGPNKKKIVAIVAGAAVVLLAGSYIAGSVMFTGRFFPNTVIGQVDVSMKTAEEAAALLADAERDYSLQVTGQGLDFTISSEQAGIGIDAQPIIDGILKESNPWAWPFNLIGKHDESDRLAASSNEQSLSEAVHAAVDAFNEGAVPSEDATVVFDEEAGAFVVKGEVYGQQISVEKVIEAAAKAMATMDDELVLDGNVLIAPSVLSNDEKLAAAVEKANTMVASDITLVEPNEGAEVGELDGSTVAGWVYLDDDLNPVLDEEALYAWAQELSGTLSTVGATRNYTRPDGKSVEISGGDYGWTVDSDSLVASLKEAVSNGTVGELEVPFLSTGNGYTAEGQDWGAYCDIDLSEQHAYYYDESGSLLWDSPVVTGKPNGDDTPTGVYYLKNLESPSVLRGPKDPATGKPEWESPVDYWMPFVGNMVGLHDASWQPSSVFGDPSAYQTYGSHGCVNLPVGAAGELFSLIKIGDVVVVHW